MNKTTIYLPDDLKAALERTAAESGRSKAELIREGIALVTAPRPRGPLFSSGDPMFAHRVDELLVGFGED
jgi:hypothetical protein